MEGKVEFQSKGCEIMGVGADNVHTVKGTGGA